MYVYLFIYKYLYISYLVILICSPIQIHVIRLNKWRYASSSLWKTGNISVILILKSRCDHFCNNNLQAVQYRLLLWYTAFTWNRRIRENSSSIKFSFSVSFLAQDFRVYIRNSGISLRIIATLTQKLTLKRKCDFSLLPTNFR